MKFEFISKWLLRIKFTYLFKADQKAYALRGFPNTRKVFLNKGSYAFFQLVSLLKEYVKVSIKFNVMLIKVIIGFRCNSCLCLLKCVDCFLQGYNLDIRRKKTMYEISISSL